MNFEEFNFFHKINKEELKNVNGGFWPITWTAGWGNIMRLNPEYWVADNMA